jgi:hypothetical protein
MQMPLVVVDDDLELLKELRAGLRERSYLEPMIAPPEFAVDIDAVRKAVADARAIVLDLNIGGSVTYGTAILRRLPKEKSDVPVLIWTKYVNNTILWETSRMFSIGERNELSAFSEADLATKPEARLISDLRRIRRNLRGVVTKLLPEPIDHLIYVLRHLQLIGAAENPGAAGVLHH